MKESAKPASAEGAKRRIPHRWSGWPGAVCMDCGREDLREVVCCVEHDVYEPAVLALKLALFLALAVYLYVIWRLPRL